MNPNLLHQKNSNGVPSPRKSIQKPFPGNNHQPICETDAAGTLHSVVSSQNGKLAVKCPWPDIRRINDQIRNLANHTATSIGSDARFSGGGGRDSLVTEFAKDAELHIKGAISIPQWESPKDRPFRIYVLDPLCSGKEISVQPTTGRFKKLREIARIFLQSFDTAQTQSEASKLTDDFIVRVTAWLLDGKPAQFTRLAPQGKIE